MATQWKNFRRSLIWTVGWFSVSWRRVVISLASSQSVGWYSRSAGCRFDSHPAVPRWKCSQETEPLVESSKRPVTGWCPCFENISNSLTLHWSSWTSCVSTPCGIYSLYFDNFTKCTLCSPVFVACVWVCVFLCAGLRSRWEWVGRPLQILTACSLSLCL